ncbi:hypothetical protein BLA29_014057, partial [Euroglyphus maynei]
QQQQQQRILAGNENDAADDEAGLDVKKLTKRKDKQKSSSRLRIAQNEHHYQHQHQQHQPQTQPQRRESLTKNFNEKVKRIPSDAPTALIAPTDYEHIYSIKNTNARYYEDEQHRLAQVNKQHHDHPNHRK